jgi:hypothetical protein
MHCKTNKTEIKGSPDAICSRDREKNRYASGCSALLGLAYSRAAELHQAAELY